MRLKLLLDEETAQRLIALAKRERRPVDWQAEVVLRNALSKLRLDSAASVAEASANWPQTIVTDDKL